MASQQARSRLEIRNILWLILEIGETQPTNDG